MSILANPISARVGLRVGAATAAAALSLVATATPAGAHVTVTPSTTAAGAYSVLTFSVGHGCEASPTTEIAISIPEEILSVTPTRQPLWKVTKKKETLETPVTDAHGNTVTERDATVVYTARTPLPDGYRDAFELSVLLPEEEGLSLAFPAVQTCQQGETPWTEIAAEGQDPHELEHPAPIMTLSAGAEDAHGTDHEPEDAEDAPSDQDTEAEADATTSGGALGVAGLVAGLLGLVAGGAALWQVRRRP